MKDYVKYGRARDQLYHLKVQWRQLVESIPVPRRTPQLVQTLDMVEAVIENACETHERGQVLAMQLDVYDVVELPGFAEHFGDGNENPYKS
jgi:hypothetical protein